MLLAKIVGTVVATRKDPRLESAKLLVARGMRVLVCKALVRDGVAVVDELSDRLVERNDLRHSEPRV